MLNFYSSLSPATKLLIQSFLAVLGSVLVGTGTAVYQSYMTSGSINIASIWVTASLTFGLLFGKAMHDWIPAHAKEEMEALRDSEAQLHDALARSQSITQSAINKNVVAASQSQNGPLVVIHTASVTPVPTPDVNVLGTTQGESFEGNLPTVNWSPPDVSKLDTASVPVAQLPFPEPVDIPAQATNPEIPAVNMALHFGDSGLVPLVTP